MTSVVLNGKPLQGNSNGRRPHAVVVQQTEAYRILRSQLDVALRDTEMPVVLVTSALAHEGKTTTVANLAASLAGEGRRVGLVDLDLRHPDVHNWFDVPNDKGVSDVLLGRRKLVECVQYVEVATPGLERPGGLYLLTTGEKLENPAELLSGGKTARLLQVMARQSEHPRPSSESQLDIVLVDTPPVLPVADALIVGRIVSGALLVLLAGKTPTGTVQRAKDALIRNQTRLYGIVMNGANAETGYGYGYGYGYGQR